MKQDIQDIILGSGGNWGGGYANRKGANMETHTMTTGDKGAKQGEISQEVARELLEALKTLKADMQMLYDGTWDVSTDEGLEACNDSIEVANRAIEKAESRA